MRYGIDELKKQKYYKKGDIIVYLLIAVTIFTLIAVFVIPKNAKELEKINIYYADELIYTYDYISREGEKTQNGSGFITEQAENEKRYIKIVTEDGENQLEIGKDYAKMVHADCSVFADCITAFKPITQGGDIIICLPNKIKIIGEGKTVENEVRL